MALADDEVIWEIGSTIGEAERSGGALYVGSFY